MVKKLPYSLRKDGKKWQLYDDVDYDAFWADQHQKRQDQLERYLISRFLLRTGSRIIDIGCGYGRLLPCYRDKFSVKVLYDGSIKLLKKAIEETGDTNQNRFFIAGDINLLPFKEASFDCVLMIRVIQHLFDVESSFQEVSRILSDSGVFIFSYHNKQNAHRIMNWFLGREKDNPFSRKSKEVSPALVSHHPAYIKSRLMAAKFARPDNQGAVVVKQIANLTEKISKRVPSGTRWARITGKFWAAPWIISRTRALSRPSLAPGQDLIDILVCPFCRISVKADQGGFVCPSCQRIFPARDGIIDFRPDGKDAKE